MPYARPTLTQLREQVMQDINSSSLGVNGFLRSAVLPVLGWAMAALAYLHYGYIDWISKQAVPWTATDEYLLAWGALIGVTRKAPTIASGNVTFSGTQGSAIASGSTVTCSSNGLTYTTTAIGTIDATLTVTVPVICATAGADGNLTVGTPVSLSSPPSGVSGSSGVVATGGLIGGADEETPDDYKSRVLQEFAAPPHGGDASDYVEWALAVSGVTRAWVTPLGMGAGTVVVYTMMDDAESAYGGFPQGSNGVASTENRAVSATGDQLSVANAIKLEQPVTALVYSCAPVKTPVDFSITGLGSNNTTAMQASIEAALTSMFLQQAQVGGAIDPTTNEVYGPMQESAWYGALEAVSGLTAFNVASPSSAITPTAGELLVLGTVTYSS